MKVRLDEYEIGLGRYLALWSVVGVVFALQGFGRDALIGQVWGFFDYVRWSIIQWGTWACLAPLVFRLGARHPIGPPHWLRSSGIHVLLSLGVTQLALTIGAAVSTPFEPSSFGEQYLQFLGQHGMIGLFTYWALLAIQLLLRMQKERIQRETEAARLAAELDRSRLQALKTQLQPHFLFNTLHAIVTLLDEDKVSAEDMLLRLSDLLRAFLEEYDGQEITLRRELTLLDLYLGIQRKRFKDRLTTRVYIAPETLDCAVPSLLLQPIVENAIRHGIGQRVGADCIEIESRRDGDTLQLEVRNGNSTLETDRGNAGHGIGLSNTRLRLKTLYGDAAEVRLNMTWPQGVACRIRLPFRTIEEADDAPEHVAA
ncbi:MAG TPA: histidine kinase [Luteimonas sp.]|nr:histidine kinase [Luteimonas sp.]